MKIDLAEWTEYISDDSEGGSPPLDIELEFMQVVTMSKVVCKKDEIGPWTWRKAPGNDAECKTYWRVKK